MLEPKQQSEDDGHLVIEAEERARFTRALHERHVGGEKEGIVVVAKKAMTGGEGRTNRSKTLGDGLAGRCRVVMRHD